MLTKLSLIIKQIKSRILPSKVKYKLSSEYLNEPMTTPTSLDDIKITGIYVTSTKLLTPDDEFTDVIGIKQKLKYEFERVGLGDISMFSVHGSEGRPSEYTIKVKLSKGTYERRTWITPDFRNNNTKLAFQYTGKALDVLFRFHSEFLTINESPDKRDEILSIIVNFGEEAK